MGSRELDAAGITDPVLRESYLRCRATHAAHGRTYFLATLLLPPGRRPYVHALYGLARHADEIVDDLSSTLTPQQKADELGRWADGFLRDVRRGRSDDPVAAAVVDTVLRWEIPVEHFEAFFRSMRMDLTVTEYATYDELYEYVHGSAAVIGLQMLPVLGAVPGREAEARTAAQDLGVAFQLANFVRDVGEDLDRGRLYLPLDEVAAAGLTRADLERRVVDDRVRDLLRGQVARVRALSDAARPGISALHPTSRPCIEAARTLYCGIVDEVERIDYQVFTSRATVPRTRRLAVAGPAWVRAAWSRTPVAGRLSGRPTAG